MASPKTNYLDTLPSPTCIESDRLDSFPKSGTQYHVIPRRESYYNIPKFDKANGPYKHAETSTRNNLGTAVGLVFGTKDNTQVPRTCGICYERCWTSA